MLVSVLLTGLVAFGSFTYANPVKVKRSGGDVVTYWGFGGERSLSDYCASGQDINILILSFLSNFGGGNYPNGGFGDCTISNDGSFNSACSDLASEVQTCQDAGIKVFVSVGGGGAQWVIDGTDDASGIASSLWLSWGGNTTYSPRPFGNVKIDGWDFDIESNPNNQSQAYLGDLVNDLRGYFSQDTSKTYYISGAPQCPLPEENMGPAMMKATFDYLWIQFYNNDCAAAGLINSTGKNPDGKGTYNLASWPGYLKGGASSAASLYVGLPGSGASAPRYDFIYPRLLPKVIAASPGIGGIMIWNAAASDASVHNGCNYAQTAASIFSTGQICSAS